MSKKFTKELVDECADKLLIGLTEEENQMVLDEFAIIDEDINLINNIPNIENVEPMSHALDEFEFELREDEVVSSVPLEDLFKNCDSYREDEIKVPKVVD